MTTNPPSKHLGCPPPMLLPTQANSEAINKSKQTNHTNKAVKSYLIGVFDDWKQHQHTGKTKSASYTTSTCFNTHSNPPSKQTVGCPSTTTCKQTNKHQTIQPLNSSGCADLSFLQPFIKALLTLPPLCLTTFTPSASNCSASSHKPSSLMFSSLH